MAEVVLEPSAIHSAGRYPVNVDRERQPSGFASPSNRAFNAHAAERLATLIDKHLVPAFTDP